MKANGRSLCTMKLYRWMFSFLAGITIVFGFELSTWLPKGLSFGHVSLRGSQVSQLNTFSRRKSATRLDDSFQQHFRSRIPSLRLNATQQTFEKHKKGKKKKKVPLPFMNMESVGVSGRWMEIGGNFVLEPANGIEPVAIVHFLGGAFVGAAPHLSYRYLLESLAERGLVVIATPYRLDLDYLRICDGVIAKVDVATKYIHSQYGPLPVVGVGHSCGALLHSLLSSLFPDINKDLNVLIAFNNRPASHAIPAFHELLVPLSKQIMSEQLPTKGVRDTVNYLRRYVDLAVELYSDSGISPTFVSDEIVPLLRQGFEIVDQVPPLMKVIAEGRQEFSPSPYHTKEVLRMMYRAKKTLLLQFENDASDESLELEKILKESNTIMRMKLNRTMQEMEVDRKKLDGSHSTPLTQNLLVEIAPNTPILVPETYNNLRKQFNTNFMTTINEVSNAIATFILEYYSEHTYQLVQEQVMQARTADTEELLKRIEENASLQLDEQVDYAPAHPSDSEDYYSRLQPRQPKKRTSISSDTIKVHGPSLWKRYKDATTAQSARFQSQTSAFVSSSFESLHQARLIAQQGTVATMKNTAKVIVSVPRHVWQGVTLGITAAFTSVQVFLIFIFQMFSELFQMLQGGTGDAGQVIGRAMSNTTTFVLETIRNILDSIVFVSKRIAGIIAAAALTLYTGSLAVGAATVSGIVTASTVVASAVAALFVAAGGIFASGGKGVGEMFSAMAKALSSGSRSIVSGVSRGGQSAVRGVSYAMTSTTQTLGSGAVGTLQGVSSALRSIANSVVLLSKFILQTFTNVIKGIWSALAFLSEELLLIGEGLIRMAGNMVQSLFRASSNAVAGTFQAVASGAVMTRRGVVSAVSGVGGMLIGFGRAVGRTVGAIGNLGQDIVRGVGGVLQEFGRGGFAGVSALFRLFKIGGVSVITTASTATQSVTRGVIYAVEDTALVTRQLFRFMLQTLLSITAADVYQFSMAMIQHLIIVAYLYYVPHIV